MSAATGTGRKVIRMANKIVNITVLFVILLLLAFGCYTIWDSGQVYRAADAARYEVYKPTAENEGLSFEELQAINPEVAAWLTVFGTHIDYPVVQGQDNLKYVNTNAKGEYSLTGAIFLDSKCATDFSGFVSILYGHHMERNTMFGEIGSFADKDYFDARRYGMLYYDGQEHGIEFFAFANADAYSDLIFRTDITGQDERQEYLDILKKAAFLIREDVKVSADDRLILLSTCSVSNTNGRDILIGKITNDVYNDSFKTESVDKPAAIPVIDAISGFFAEIPSAICFCIIAILFLLILLTIALLYKKKKYPRK